MTYPYSVLMSVYAGENAVNLRASINSVLTSEFPPAEFILVIDGPVGDDLMEVIHSFPAVKPVPLPSNVGLGAALNEGLKHVSYDIVARMDSDDICMPSRLGKEYARMSEGLDIVSSAILEFEGDVSNVTGRRDLPLTQEQIEEAAKIANAYDFITASEQGFDTNIGDRGGRLSGGQRQRVSIARAILKNPPILILDEATSALDTESERLVQDALERLMKTRTTVAIAHRLSTIKNADEICVLHDGKIVERGTHEGLLAQDGYYKKLHDMQS